MGEKIQITEWWEINMEITHATVLADDCNHYQLTIKTEEGETIRVGEKISIIVTDEDIVEHIAEHEIASMRIWKLEPNGKRGNWIDVESVSNGQACIADIYGIEGYVQTTEMPSPAEMRAERERLATMINVMPYKEIHGGEESIYDYIDENFAVPAKVIVYLKTTQPYLVCMGLYKHPFKDMQLCGPYWYTDGEYFWDRDAWKYVIKYHVTLPQKFIDKVMSDEGTAFLEKCAESDESWVKRIKEWKKNPNTLCLMPENADDYSLDDF
ncbi:MAG TPA: hypothetical protein DCZ40_08240 [Lachnospiraceae bacterium]|nr:hypothetical protein [Lachnospiraceae bacterium]